jgi:hypothetical protein
MSAAEPEATTPTPSIHWFHVTFGHCLAALLIAEGLLWLSERFGWLPWHKGYAVLTAVAAVGVVLVGMLLRFAVALLFRRRFQFTIRSLLVLVVVVAMPCSWLGVEMKKAKTQEKYAESIMEVGAGIGLANTSVPVWLRRVFGEYFFVRVDSVQFAIGGKVHSGDLSRVQGLNTLEDIWLSYTTVTDGELAELQELPCLRTLSLGYTGITDAGLRNLEGLGGVRELDLRDTKITDAGLEHLHRLPRLQRLNVQGTNVTAEGAKKLQQALPNCKIYR